MLLHLRLYGIAPSVMAMRYSMSHSGAIARLIVGVIMDNAKENKADQSLNPSSNQPNQTSDELADESVIVSDETHGNRAEEKIEDRAAKKRELHEEVKSITGSEAHKDVTNEHAGEGPAPLDRY